MRYFVTVFGLSRLQGISLHNRWGFLSSGQQGVSSCKSIRHPIWRRKRHLVRWVKTNLKAWWGKNIGTDSKLEHYLRIATEIAYFIVRRGLNFIQAKVLWVFAFGGDSHTASLTSNLRHVENTLYNIQKHDFWTHKILLKILSSYHCHNCSGIIRHCVGWWLIWKLTIFLHFNRYHHF